MVKVKLPYKNDCLSLKAEKFPPNADFQNETNPLFQYHVNVSRYLRERSLKSHSGDAGLDPEFATSKCVAFEQTAGLFEPQFCQVGTIIPTTQGYCNLKG